MSRREQIRMTAAEVAGFLAEERTVTCATIGQSGWPHLMPLWYVLRGHSAGEPGPRIWSWTYGASQKVRNIERDPRATLQVESGEPYCSPDSTCSVARGSRSMLRTFCEAPYVHDQMRGPGSPAECPRSTYHSGIRCGQPLWPIVAHVTVRSSARKPATSAAVILICSLRLMRGAYCQAGWSLARRSFGRRRAGLPWASVRRLTASRTASRASLGSSTAASPASLRISRTSQSTPAKLSSTTTAPSLRSSTTRRASRAQRARSGETHTRALRDACTSPVRSQPSVSYTHLRAHETD